jgi:hypothetical protein
VTPPGRPGRLDRRDRRALLRLGLRGTLALPALAGWRPARGAELPPAATPARRPGRGRGPFVITDRGALPDGKTLSTKAIQASIDACHKAGGGQVLVPPGRYLTAPIFLRSNVELHLMTGATLQATTDKSLYPLIDGRHGGVERKVHASLITGLDLENVSVTGNGVLDGDGFHWINAEQECIDLRIKRKLVTSEGLAGYPEDAPLKHPRPRLINLVKCSRVDLTGFTLERTPHYNVHLVYCDDVAVTGVRAKLVDKTLNASGVVVDSCRNVRISGCAISSGDDGISLKAGFGEDGRRVALDCSDIVIQNCTFTDSDGAAVAIGSETAGGIHNIVVTGCVMDNVKWGFRVKTNRGRGGYVDNVRVSDLVIKRARRHGIELTAWHDITLNPPVNLEAGPPETTPEVRNIDISDVTVSVAPMALHVRGLPERPFHSLTVRGLTSNQTDAGVRCENVENVLLDKLSVASAKAPALVAKGARDLEVRNLRSHQPAGALPVIELEDADNVLIAPSRLPTGTSKLLALKGTRNAAIVIEGNILPAGAIPTAPGVISVR